MWQVAQYLLQLLQNPKFLRFVSLRPVWGRCWYDVLLSFLLICSTSTCPETCGASFCAGLAAQPTSSCVRQEECQLHHQKMHQHVCSVSMHVPCGACNAFTKSTVSICFQVRPGLNDLSQRSSLKLYTSLLCFMKPSQNGIEHKSLGKFCAGRGICADVASGAEKFTLGSRICLGGTGYSWPGLFSGSLYMQAFLLTKPSLFFVGLVMFFNWVNLDTKLRVAILGQDFDCVVTLFRFLLISIGLYLLDIYLAFVYLFDNGSIFIQYLGAFCIFSWTDCFSHLLRW